MIVNVFTGPSHPTEPLVKRGMTVIVATTGVEPLFTAVKELILPLPVAAKPIEGVLLTQLYVVVPPLLVVPKLTTAVLAPLQTT